MRAYPATSGSRSIASAKRSRAPWVSPPVAARQASSYLTAALSGWASSPSSSVARAPSRSPAWRCADARNVHSHAEGSNVAGPPKLSTVVPASAATAWRCAAGSGTNT